MKKHLLRILFSIAVVTLFGTVSHASPRARFRAETILNDSSVRLSAVCKVNDDGTVSCWGRNAEGQLGIGSIGDPSPVPVLVKGIGNAVAVANGAGFNCALLADGTAKCWGLNAFGELGDGTTTDQPAPVAVSGLSNAVAIAGGGLHACALLSTGRVRCWGFNFFGELGDGTSTDQHTPVTVFGIASAVAITTGAFHSCALLANGTATCWGLNQLGQLGDGTETERHFPVTVSGISNAVAIATGHSHNCVVLADGTAKCWGYNDYAQIGDGTVGSVHHIPNAVSNLSNAVAITAGVRHTCALLADGTAKCWGSNEFGQIGDGTTGGGPVTPVAVTGLSNAVAIKSYGFLHTCAQQANGITLCWGLNDLGWLGIDTFSNSSIPQVVKGSGGSFTARDIAAGNDHTCAVRANGTVACWGRNDSGQIGDGTRTFRLSPVTLSGISNAVAVAAGEAHTCALLANGTVRCWGLNAVGQLGDGTQIDRLTPVAVPNLTNVVAIAAGGNFLNLGSHTCALLADGTVRCWGANTNGQLGNGTVSSVQATPVTVRIHTIFGDFNLSGAVSIAVGTAHSCALLANGAARCWGFNRSGQLGNNSFTDSFTADFVTGLAGAVSIAAGGEHTCALLSNSTARCWGRNDLGQLGNNSTTNQPLPVDVSNVANSVGIAGGIDHSCALFTPGAASCWGDNSRGQLGNNTTNPSLIPTQVKVKIGNLATIILPLGGAVNITTGRRHSCALLVSGSVRCWGDNTFGQVGVNSTTTLFTTAVAVPSFTLNIDPTVSLDHQGRVATVTVIATCEAGQRLFFDVNLTQGAVSGRGSGTGVCTGALERYTVTVLVQGRDPFLEGAAQVTAEANIRDGRLVVDVQEWTRQVSIVNEP